MLPAGTDAGRSSLPRGRRILPAHPELLLPGTLQLDPRSHEDEEEHADLRTLAIGRPHVALEDRIRKREGTCERKDREGLAQSVPHGVCEAAQQSGHERVPDQRLGQRQELAASRDGPRKGGKEQVHETGRDGRKHSFGSGDVDLLSKGRFTNRRLAHTRGLQLFEVKVCCLLLQGLPADAEEEGRDEGNDQHDLGNEAAEYATPLGEYERAEGGECNHIEDVEAQRYQSEARADEQDYVPEPKPDTELQHRPHCDRDAEEN